jgi:hypothetical protein
VILIGGTEMNYSTYRFALDLHSTQSQVSLPVSQYDNARVLLINLSDGGLPYVIEDGCLAMLEIKRPRGSILQSFCPIEKNATVRYEFSQDEGAASVEDGVHDCSVNLYDSEGHILGTPRFTMIVSERVVNSDNIDFSANDVTAIDAMIAKEAERQVAENARVNAEEERKAKELERQVAENARVNAEEERKAKELERQAAEAIRVENDVVRQEVAESARASADEARASADEARASADDAKCYAEEVEESLGNVGDLTATLDGILAIQEALIGGGA